MVINSFYMGVLNLIVLRNDRADTHLAFTAAYALVISPFYLYTNSMKKIKPESSYSTFQKMVFIVMAVVTILSLSGVMTLIAVKS